MDAGYYWVQHPATKYQQARWSVAKFDGSDELGWTFINSLHLMDTAELIGTGEDDMGCTIGPRISEPA